LIIRKANINDAKRLSYLIRKNAQLVEENGYTGDQRKAWGDQNKPKAIEQSLERRTVFCAFENNKMIGTIGLENEMLCGMYISYSKRGKDVGQKLISYLENYAQRKKINELKLTASPNGYGFYLKNGYEPYGEIELIFNGVKFMETKMKKRLK